MSLDNMTSKEAIDFVMDKFGIQSLYKLSKELTHEELKVTITQLSNYSRGTRMSKKVADRFSELYDVVISDVFDSTALRRNYNKGI